MNQKQVILNQKLVKKRVECFLWINIILIVSHGLWNLIFLKTYKIGSIVILNLQIRKLLKMLPRIMQLAKRQTPYMNMSSS